MSLESAIPTFLSFYRHLRNWHRWLVLLGRCPPERLLEHLKTPVVPAPGRRPQPDGIQRYVCSSRLLHQAHQHLTAVTGEQLHLVTGVLVGRTCVITEVVPVRDVERSVVHAFASAKSIREALVRLEWYGAKCVGLFHSHPGEGVGSTTPSHTDWVNHRAWEQGFPLVGAIFAGKAVRFFSSDRDLRVDVQGQRVTKLDENLYQLEVDQDISLRRPAC